MYGIAIYRAATDRKILLIAGLISLSGCISVYGPNGKAGQSTSPSVESEEASAGAAASPDNQMTITNRQYGETWDKTVSWYSYSQLTTSVNSPQAGIVAAIYANYPNATNYVTCSDLKQTENLTYSLRVVTQLYEAQEGVSVKMDVSATAGVTIDGKDKVKKVVCISNGTLENRLFETLRK